ncbi:MAG: hypothetical protein ABSB94_07355 [Syntrophorhabdales bacterium]|jgi:hypothetical protein
MQLTEELEKILKKYPRGYHAVSKEEIYEILNAYEYQAMSPGWFADWFGVSRETLRLWGKKGIIHYFIVRDKLFRALEVYIPIHTFLEAPLPNKQLYQKELDEIRREMEGFEKRHKRLQEMQLQREEAERKSK